MNRLRRSTGATPRVLALLALLVVIALLAPVSFSCTTVGGGAGSAAHAGTGPAFRAGLDPALQRGAELYDRHCALCHGVWGAGDGMAGDVLYPPARDFGTGAFNLASTTNGVPSETDLVRTLRRGMPGSAMPSWDWMPEPDLRQLAGYVRHLAVHALARTLARPEDHARALTPAQARRVARQILTPGERITPVATAAQPDPRELRRGRELYREQCSDCHGDDAKGRRVPAAWSGSANEIWTRDLTSGVLKGDATAAELGWRIVAGMPASGMPPTRLPDSELAALVAYVQSLLPADASTRQVQVRRTIRARRVDAAVPDAPDDPRWEDASAVAVVLAPLWWNDRAIRSAELAAVHDGSRIAVRIRWSDATRDDHALGDPRYRDAAAVQLSNADAPPLFGMGADQEPVEIWHWRSVRFREVAGALDLLERLPHGGGTPDVAAPIHRGPDRVEDPASVGSAQSLRAEGFERIHSERDGDGIASAAAWRDGAWSVVLSRPMRPGDDRELDLRPGDRLQIGCAIWNGAAGDRAAHKSITIWHALELAP